MEETQYTVWMKIRPLAEGLKKRNPKLGYTEVKQGGRVAKYIVHNLTGDIEIPVLPGRGLESSKKLLTELVNQARAYAPGLVAPKVRKCPLWMNDKARTFALRATAANKGVHRFGKDIRIIGQPQPTKQQIIYVAQDYLEAFFYYDPASPKIQNKPALKTVANDWNLTMYTWVEKQGFSPSSAKTKLVSLNKKLVRELIMTLAIPGVSDALSLTKDITVSTVWAIHFL